MSQSIGSKTSLPWTSRMLTRSRLFLNDRSSCLSAWTLLCSLGFKGERCTLYVCSPRLTDSFRGSEVSLDLFVGDHDTLLHGPSSSNTKPPPKSMGRRPSPLSRILHLARVHVTNDFETVPLLHKHLDDLNLFDPDRLRPSWDTYFMVGVSTASYSALTLSRH
jgi:hypothetical protein